jgi:hypothetical protein
MLCGTLVKCWIGLTRQDKQCFSAAVFNVTVPETNLQTLICGGFMFWMKCCEGWIFPCILNSSTTLR